MLPRLLPARVNQGVDPRGQTSCEVQFWASHLNFLGLGSLISISKVKLKKHTQTQIITPPTSSFSVVISELTNCTWDSCYERIPLGRFRFCLMFWEKCILKGYFNVSIVMCEIVCHACEIRDE